MPLNKKPTAGGSGGSSGITAADLAMKVNKEVGKSLIEISLIDKLRTLDNYDDTAVWNELALKANKTELHTHANKSILDRITALKIQEWDNKSTFSGDYNDLINKPDLDNLNYAKETWVLQEIVKRVPTKVSQLVNDEGYVKLSELEIENDNLTYAKKQWVLEQIANRDDFSMVKVTSLPTEAQEGVGNIDTNKIYLLQTNTNPDLYEKWINLNGTDDSWELLSSTLMDLSDYYDKTEINTMFDQKVRADKIPVIDTANEFTGTNVESVLREINKKIEDVDFDQYAKSDDLADVAFSGLYNDLLDVPIEKVTGSQANPIVISQLPNGLYFMDGVQKVLPSSPETPTTMCYGVTSVSSYDMGSLRVTSMETIRLVNGQFKSCNIKCTYNADLSGMPTIEYNYYLTSSDVLTRDNQDVYEPIDDYHPATKKYVDDALDDVDLTNYLAKDNIRVYNPTSSYHPATKKYVDDTIPKKTSELINDVPFLVEADLDDYAKKEWVKVEIANSNKLERVVVQALPALADAEENKIYMLEKEELDDQGQPTGNVYYEEYMLINGVLTLTGTSKTDLSNYATEAYVGEKTIVDWSIASDYKQGQFVLYDNTIYRAKVDVTNQNQWDETQWIAISAVTDDPEEVVKSYLFYQKMDGTYDEDVPIYVREDKVDNYTIDDIKTWVGLTQQELDNMNALIDDSVIQINKTWSSTNIYANDTETLNKSKAYTDMMIATTAGASYQKVTSIDEMVDQKVMYLMENPDNGKLEIYIVQADGSILLVGDTDIDLANYYTKQETDDTFLAEADAIITYATKQELDEVKGATTILPGVIFPYAGETAPGGYLICNGGLVSKTQYPDLFDVIGYTYGAYADNEDLFALPNLCGKMPLGVDNTNTDFDTVGNTGGEYTHTLTTNEMPSHTHTFTGTSHSHTFSGYSHNHQLSVSALQYSSTSDPSEGGNYVPVLRGLDSNFKDSNYDNFRVYNDSGSYTTVTDVDWIRQDSGTVTTTANTTAGGSITSTIASGTNANTGGGQAMNVVQPYLVMNYIIKY